MNKIVTYTSFLFVQLFKTPEGQQLFVTKSMLNFEINEKNTFSKTKIFSGNKPTWKA